MSEEANPNTESTEQGAATGDAEVSTESTATPLATGDVKEGSPTDEDWKTLAMQYKDKMEKAQGKLADAPQQQSQETQPPANGTSEWDRKVAEARRQLEYNAWELNDPNAIVTLANEQRSNQSFSQVQITAYPEEVRTEIQAAMNTGRFADAEAAYYAVLGAKSKKEQKELAVATAKNDKLVKEAKEQAQRRTEGVRSTTETPMTEAEVKEETIKASEFNRLMLGDPTDPEVQKAAADVQYGRRHIIPG